MNTNGHLIINRNTKKYIHTNTETWNGDWKLKYKHVKNADYLDILTPQLYNHDTVNNLPFTYNLCRDGGYFVIYADQNTSDEDIKKAKSMLRNDRDVVSLKVLKLNKY